MDGMRAEVDQPPRPIQTRNGACRPRAVRGRAWAPGPAAIAGRPRSWIHGRALSTIRAPRPPVHGAPAGDEVFRSTGSQPTRERSMPEPSAHTTIIAAETHIK